MTQYTLYTFSKRILNILSRRAQGVGIAGGGAKPPKGAAFRSRTKGCMDDSLSSQKRLSGDPVYTCDSRFSKRFLTVFWIANKMCITCHENVPLTS